MKQNKIQFLKELFGKRKQRAFHGDKHSFRVTLEWSFEELQFL